MEHHTTNTPDQIVHNRKGNFRIWQVLVLASWTTKLTTIGDTDLFSSGLLEPTPEGAVRLKRITLEQMWRRKASKLLKSQAEL